MHCEYCRNPNYLSAIVCPLSFIIIFQLLTQKLAIGCNISTATLHKLSTNLELRCTGFVLSSPTTNINNWQLHTLCIEWILNKGR